MTRNHIITSLFFACIVAFGWAADKDITRMQNEAEFEKMENIIDSLSGCKDFDFADTVGEYDCYEEYNEAVELGEIEGAKKAFAEIMQAVEDVKRLQKENEE